MKTNKLIFDIRYDDVFEKKSALDLMLSNRSVWENDFKDAYIMDNDFKFIKEATPEELLNKMKEIDLLIFNKYYEVIKKWTRKLENDKNLVRMAVKTWLGPFASFELNKIEPGLYEVILPEAFEFEPHWSLDFNYDEFEKIKRYIEKVSEENCEGWSDSIEVEVEEKKMYIELMPEYHFYYDFSSNFSVSIKEEPIE